MIVMGVLHRGHLTGMFNLTTKAAIRDLNSITDPVHNSGGVTTVILQVDVQLLQTVETLPSG